jgi:hypothetical protein
LVDTFDSIMNGTVEKPAVTSEDAREPLVVLADGGVHREARRAQVDAAIAALPKLRH